MVRSILPFGGGYLTESKNCDSVKDEDILKLIESVEFGRVIVIRENGKTVLVEDNHTRKPKDFKE